MPRTEVTKKLWAYIKRNGLQDAKNRRDDQRRRQAPRRLRRQVQVNMFEMTKLVSKHLS